MSKKYALRYTITRPEITARFWIRAHHEPSSYEEIKKTARSLGGTHDMQISPDGLSVIIDYKFDSDEMRKEFVDKVYEIDQKYIEKYKKQWDERNEHHEKYGLVEETTFFEETS